MFPYYFGDWTFLLLIPVLILTFYAQAKVSSAYRQYAQVQAESGLTGGRVARDILDKNGLYDVRVEETPGVLSDHYDPRTQVVRLSSDVYRTASIAAVAVAAHETGHAVQHADGYVPLKIRTAFVPVASLGSQAGPILIILGFFMASFSWLITLGIYLFAFAVLFQVVTLPVEFNASSRALVFLENQGILRNGTEALQARKMLSAAALTYVAAALVAIVNLIRFMLLARDRN